MDIDKSTIKHIIEETKQSVYQYGWLDLLVMAVEIAFIVWWFGPDLVQALSKSR